MAKRKPYSVEYFFHAKPEFLFGYLSMPYNLTLWFADKVDSRGDNFTFSWKDSSEKAKIVKQIPKKKLVFRWVERESEEYLTFDIDTDEVTGATLLRITDFDFETELQSVQMWWNVAIDKLKHVIGG